MKIIKEVSEFKGGLNRPPDPPPPPPNDDMTIVIPRVNASSNTLKT